MSAPVPAALPLGLWFDGPRPALGRIDAEADLWPGVVDSISLDLDAAGTGTVSTWRPQELIAFTGALQERGIEVWWMLRPRHTAAWVDKAVQAVAELLDSSRDALTAPWLDLDLEEGTEHFDALLVARFLDPIPAARIRLNSVPTLAGAIRPHVVPWLEHRRPDGSRAVSAHCGQCYTQDTGKTWDDHEAFRPAGRFVRRWVEAIPAHEARWPGVQQECGQALYAQQHPAPHPTGIAALEATRDVLLSAQRPIRCWSRKHATTAVRAYLRATRALLRGESP